MAVIKIIYINDNNDTRDNIYTMSFYTFGLLIMKLT